jgi:protein-S-isoprenylcysteine O-methyltransferase Ste14
LSRLLVTAAFIGAAFATALSALDHVADAVSDPTVRSWSFAGYWILRTAVVVALSVLVAVRDEARTPARAPIAFVSCAAALGSVMLLKQPSADTDTALVVLGDSIALLSYVWLVVAVLFLGRCFGILPEVRGLVTRGPYRLVRHPVYLGEFGAVAGFLIGAHTPWNAVCALVFAAGQAVRMRLEERVLEREFPEYGAYSAVTPRLLPRIQPQPAQPVAGSRAVS